MTLDPTTKYKLTLFFYNKTQTKCYNKQYDSFNYLANKPKGTRIRLKTLFAILLYIPDGGRLGRPSSVTNARELRSLLVAT